MSRKAPFRAVLAGLVGLALIAAPSALAGKRTSYSGYLTATPDVLHAGDYFDVHGCGYSTSMGNVIVGFTGGGWGSPLSDPDGDGYGCFTITDIPALSGDTLPDGTYEVTAKQFNGKRWVETGETTVTVVS